MDAGLGRALELFGVVHASECSKPYHAILWIDDGDLHWGNTELLVAMALRFGLDMLAQVVPRQYCPCGWYGGTTVAQAHTTEEWHATNVAQREWAMHALTCPKGARKRGVLHDALSSVFQLMLENAGFLNVQLEDA